MLLLLDNWADPKRGAAACRMMPYDSLTPAYRALVAEYGDQQAIYDMYAARVPPEHALQALEEALGKPLRPNPRRRRRRT